MRIGVKLALSLVIPLVLVAAVIGYLYWQQSRAFLRTEFAREGRAIAMVVSVAAEDYLRDQKLEDLRQLAERVKGYERVQGLRLFDAAGRLTYQSNTLDPYPFQHVQALKQVLQDRMPRETRRMIGAQPAVGYIFPLVAPAGNLLGAVQVVQLESFMKEDASQALRFILVLSLAMVVSTVLIVLLVTRASISRPIQDLVERFRQVGAREPPAWVQVRGDDELSRLASEFNGMCERLDAARRSLLEEQDERRIMEARLHHADRLAGLGRLAAGVAHEIGTPLNVIGGRAEALSRFVAGQEAPTRHVRIITAQIERIARSVRAMLDFARMKPTRRAEIDPLQSLKAVLELMERELEGRKVRARLETEGEIPRLIADADQLQQVYLNIVINAIDAMPGGGTLRVQASERSVRHPERGGPPRRFLFVSFEDTGIGVAMEHREHVFDPFFTTKPIGSGTGLGLSVSYGIVREHGGWIDFTSEPGRGTRVTVVLPLDAREVERVREAAS